ncbi:peptide MFS transporter [Phenylobacterium sp.]|uniref:peptide MFS transporter n=1 Tax=Phenylobacterium sp. TaxID=1871053 RepID=UPI0035B07740
MTVAAAPTERSWFGQPPGLTVLFLTEMWEKFSFFGMRALLVYYMTKQLLMPQAQASMVYGLYAAFVYFTPIVGGVLSDRWLGRRRAVILGGSIMAVGHFMMAFEPLLYGALACIALGNGLFLPSLPSQIGALYKPDDPRRGRAYNVYYVGINLGAFLAPLVCGTLGEVYGWHYGFGAAGLGMLAGLSLYIAGGRHLPPEPPRAARQVRSERGRTGGAAVLILLGVGLAVVVFRGAYEQVGNTVALWADQGVDRRVGEAFSIPMTWFQSLNPLLVFTLTPLFLAFWSRQAERGREPSAGVKMALGAFGVAASYLLLAAASSLGVQASWIWLAAFFAVFTAAELYILPVGLGLFARAAPAGMAATAVAAWFFASFAGNLLAGVLGALWSRLSPAPFFALMAAVAGLSALGLLALSPLTRRVEAQGAADAPAPAGVGQV